MSVVKGMVESRTSYQTYYGGFDNWKADLDKHLIKLIGLDSDSIDIDYNIRGDYRRLQDPKSVAAEIADEVREGY